MRGERKTVPDLVQSKIKSPIGPLSIVTRAGVILICEFSDQPARLSRQLKQYYDDVPVSCSAAPPEIADAFSRYFAGERDALDNMSTAPEGTSFEKRVWVALRTVKAGNTASYGDIAKRLKSSPRAVGRANGRNPIALIHPCHRIIGADGTLTGYAGGLARKDWLLKHEGVLLCL